ncbi:MAG: hypothetical protein AAF636_25005 [Pseudomonadota bacterium]
MVANTSPIILFLLLAAGNVASADHHPIRPDALEILREADENLQSLLSLQYSADRVLNVTQSDRAALDLPGLTNAQVEEVRFIVAELDRGQIDARRVIEEGDRAIADEIVLAAQQAQSAARFAAHQRRNQLYQQLFQDVIGLTGAIQPYAHQQRIHELRGSPENAREAMPEALADRGLASEDNYVTDDAGLPVEELFNPLRANRRT